MWINNGTTFFTNVSGRCSSHDRNLINVGEMSMLMKGHLSVLPLFVAHKELTFWYAGLCQHLPLAKSY